MYKNVASSIDTAFEKVKKSILKDIARYTELLKDAKKRYAELKPEVTEVFGEFEKLFGSYGYKACDLRLINLYSDNNMSFCICKDESFKIPVKIRRSKKTKKFYVAFEIKINSTLVDESDEEEITRMQNAMYGRPTLHLRTDSDKEVKDIFFAMADGLRGVKESKSATAYRNKCTMYGESLKLLKSIDILDD